MISDIILVIHFFIVAFIVSGLFLIPVGYSLNWRWVKNLKIRITHLGLMIIITLETLLGLSCPLTIIENSFHEMYESESFVKFWIKKLIYWDFPNYFFVVLYLVCLGWIILMWILFQTSNINFRK